MKKAYIILIFMLSLLFASTTYAEATIQITFNASDCTSTIQVGGLEPSAPASLKIYETDSDNILYIGQEMTDEDGNFSYTVHTGTGNFTAEITCADVNLSQNFFVADSANQNELLDRINNVSNYHELEEFVMENSDVLEIDLYLYNKVKPQYQSDIFKRLATRQYNSLDEFCYLFDEICYEVYNNSKPSGSGGSSGSKFHYDLSAACFENGGISLDLKISDDLTETDKIFIAIYKAGIDKLTAISEVPFLDYPVNEDGFRQFSMHIPYEEAEKVRIKILGFSSIENLIPIACRESFLSDETVEPKTLSVLPQAVTSADTDGFSYIPESNSSRTIRIDFESNFGLYQNGQQIEEFTPDLLSQNGLRSILCTDSNGNDKYEKIELEVTDIFIINYIDILNNIYTVLPDASENSFGTYFEPISFTEGSYTLSGTSGAAVAPSDLKKGDVLAIHDNDGFLDITLIRNSVHGTVTKIAKDSLYIDNVPYSFTKEINILPGNSIIAFLDDLGRICKISKQCSAKPAVITNFTDEEIGSLELLTQDGKITVNNIDEIMIDSSICTWQTASNLIPKNTLCLYETDPQSGLPSLYLSEQNEFRYTDYLGIGTYNSLASTLGDFKLTKDTVLFAGDGESPENATTFVNIDKDYLTNGYVYRFDAIINEYNEIISLILYPSLGYGIYYNTYPMIITDTARVYKDGKVGVELSGYINGVPNTLTVSLKEYNKIDADNTGLEGSVIFYSHNIFTNELTVDFLAKMQNGELTFKDNGLLGDMVSSTNGSSAGEYVTYSLPYRNQTEDNGRLPGFAAVSMVDRIENRTLYFADSDKSLRIAPNALAYMISLPDGKISKTTIMDLETTRYNGCDDYIYVYAYNGYVKLIYIIDVDGDNNTFEELYDTVTFTALGADKLKNVIYTAPSESNIPYKISLNPNFVSYNITDSEGQSMTLSDIRSGDVITLRPMRQINSDKQYYWITVLKN